MGLKKTNLFKMNGKQNGPVHSVLLLLFRGSFLEGQSAGSSLLSGTHFLFLLQVVN